MFNQLSSIVHEVTDFEKEIRYEHFPTRKKMILIANLYLLQSQIMANQISTTQRAVRNSFRNIFPTMANMFVRHFQRLLALTISGVCHAFLANNVRTSQ